MSNSAGAEAGVGGGAAFSVPTAATAVAASAAPASSVFVPRLSARKRSTRSSVETTDIVAFPPNSRQSYRPPVAAHEDSHAIARSTEVGREPDEPEAAVDNASANPREAINLSQEATVLRHYFVETIFFRSFILFVVLAGLVTTFWHWKITEPSLLATSIGGEMTGVDETWTKTIQTLKARLDLIDVKVHKEVAALRSELERKIDEQTTSFQLELQNIGAKTQGLVEASLKKITEGQGFPGRQDVLKLVKFAVDERAAEGSGKALSLDDVRAVARRLVEAELEKHASDGIGKVDFALGAAGGRVVDHSEGFHNNLGTGWFQFTGKYLPGAARKHPLAYKLLEPSFGEPGHCLPLKGSSNYVEIALRTHIFPEAFSLEHVSKSVAYDVSSAPKDFRVFGWLDTYKELRSATSVSEVLLGEFAYDVENEKNIQTFAVPQESRERLVNMIRLDVLSNNGNPSYTCIYRFRVHGSHPGPVLPVSL